MKLLTVTAMHLKGHGYEIPRSLLVKIRISNDPFAVFIRGSLLKKHEEITVQLFHLVYLQLSATNVCRGTV